MRRDFELGEWTARPERLILEREGEAVRIKPKSMEVLVVLARRASEVVSREELLDVVWRDAFVTEDVLTQAIADLRRVLDDDVGQPRYIETIPRRGYRLIARVEEVSLSAGRRPSSRAVAVVAALVLGSGIAWWGVTHTTPSEGPARRLAVLPFEYLGAEASFGYLADGLTDELITELNSLAPDELDVIARASVMHFKGTQRPLSDIADRLKVDYVVEGTVRHGDGRLRITAQLIQTDDETHLWAKSYERPLRDILDLQYEIAHDIAEHARVSLGSGREGSREPVDAQAYRYLLEGKEYFYRFHPEGYRKARDLLEAAVRIEPNHAPAHGWLAAAYGGLAFGERTSEERERLARRARAAAERALELSPELGVARLVLAWQAFVHDWEWDRAEALFQEALAADPNSWWIHWGYAELLSALRRSEEAIDHMRTAHELDPVNPFVNVELSAVYNHAGRFMEASTVIREALEILPHHQELHDRLTRTHELLGRYEDAIRVRESHSRLLERPYDAETHRAAYARDGERGYWEWLLDDSLWRTDKLSRARVLVRLGRHEEALSLLEELVAERSPPVVYVGVDPDLRPLHDDPRFRSLVRSMGLESALRE